jgi:hypothetical protein
MFPRAMNNIEKANLAVIKELGLSYDLTYNYSRYSGGYMANLPEIQETWSLTTSISKEHYERTKRFLQSNSTQLKLEL